MKCRQLPRGNDHVVINYKHAAIFPVGEPYTGIRIISPHGYQYLGLEAEVVLNVEGLDLKVLDLVGRVLGMINIEEIENETGKEEDEEEEEAIATANAPTAEASTRSLFRMVTGYVTAVRWRFDGCLALKLHVGRRWCVHFGGTRIKAYAYEGTFWWVFIPIRGQQPERGRRR